MKRKRLTAFLAVEALLLGGLTVAQAAFSRWVAAAAAFPFEQIGLLLRRLSLSGGTGNRIAIVLYVLLSLLPLLAGLWQLRRDPAAENWLLVLISGCLFGVLYLMINPGLIPVPLGETVGKAVLGGTIYSLLAAWLVLRIVRQARTAEQPQLMRVLRILLVGLACVFVAEAAAGELGVLLASVEQLREKNTDGGIGLTCAVLALGWAVDSLPCVLNVWVLYAALDLLEAERYSEAAAAAAELLARRSGAMLAVVVLTKGGFNLLQLLLAARLRQLSSVVLIPVFDVAFALAMLLLARLMRENKQLKDENDLFV